MLLTRPARGAYTSGNAVSEKLRKGPGIFMGDHTSDRPTYAGVYRRKRVAANKETARAAADKGPLPTGRVFEDLCIQNCAKSRLSAENSGFAFLIIVLEVSQQE